LGVHGDCNDPIGGATDACAFQAVKASDGGKSWAPVGSQQAFAYKTVGSDDGAQMGFVAADAETGWLLGSNPMVTHDGGHSLPDKAPAVFGTAGPAGRHTLGNLPMEGYQQDLLGLANGALYLSRDKFDLVARSLDVGAQLRFKSRSPEPPSPSRVLRASEATRYASSRPSGGQARR